MKYFCLFGTKFSFLWHKQQIKDYFKIDIHNPCFELTKLVIILISKDTNLKLHPTTGTFHEQTPLQTYCMWSLKRQNLGEKWCNLSNQDYKDIVDFKISIIRRQWACFMHMVLLTSPHKRMILSIELISLCQINICGERWASSSDVRTKSIQKDISCPSKLAEKNHKNLQRKTPQKIISPYDTVGTSCDLFMCASSTCQTHLTKRVIAQIKDKHIYTKYQLYP